MTIETTIGRISAKIPGLGESSYEIIAITKNLPTDDRRFYTPGDPQVSLRVEARSQDGPNVLIFRGWVKDGAAAGARPNRAEENKMHPHLDNLLRTLPDWVQNAQPAVDHTGNPCLCANWQYSRQCRKALANPGKIRHSQNCRIMNNLASGRDWLDVAKIVLAMPTAR